MFLVATFVLIVVGVIGLIGFNRTSEIDKTLKTESYSYLPKAAQNYIKEVYEETGETSEYGYIPEEFIVEHSYKNDVIIEKQGVDGENTAEELSYYNLRDEGYITNIYDQGSEGLCWAFASSTSLESHLAKKVINRLC